EVSEEYREAFGEHAYDEQGNYIGYDYGGTEFTPETEAQAAWAEYVAEHGAPPEGAEGGPAAPPPPPPSPGAEAPAAVAPTAEVPTAEVPVADTPVADTPVADSPVADSPVASPEGPDAAGAPGT
ncbi:MAG TPA: hypothetical protein VK215_05180, partial [Acidimicrobiales bacterium]|nr:hypothetical protein [Acidimicrobiales bacterium]